MMRDPLAGKPLRYLIGADSAGPGDDNAVTEVGYDVDRPVARGISIGYCNLFDEKNSGDFGPYLRASDTAAEYNEGQIDPSDRGWIRNLAKQFKRRQEAGFEYIELDNADAYAVLDVIGAIDLAECYGLKVIAKNPGLTTDPLPYIRHRNVFGIIVERDAGTPEEMDALCREAGKPDLPVWFVACGAGRAWAEQTAQNARRFANMGVTWSSHGEYENAVDLLVPEVAIPSHPQEPEREAVAMRISQDAFDLIVAEEVGSRAAYKPRPEWPGAQSGPTVGIGYDLGQTAHATIAADWQGRVPPAMLEAMMSASGKTGRRGKSWTARIRSEVSIPWDMALAVHRGCVIPRWEAATAKALPNTNRLSPDCFGALVSLTFNRGAALYSRAGDRYREMRAIKAALASGHFAAIPDLIRSMKRIWRGRGVDGLLRRREREADLFERGLAAQPHEDAPAMDDSDTPVWLATMRAIDGTHETPGGADNPTIMGWRDTISRAFPELAGYTRTYTHDSIPWCGLTVAYVMAANGIKPPSTFLWARDWAKWGVHTKPRPGAVMVFSRGSGGHVALYEGETATQYIIRGGNQADAVNVTRIDKSRLLDARWPDEVPQLLEAEPPAVTTMPVPIAEPARPGFFRTVLSAIKGDAPTVAADQAPVSRPGLEPDGDPQLYDIQAQLAAKGYVMVGVADGEMGPNTRAAILAFRSENGLPVTAEVDDQFRAALAGAPYRQIATRRGMASIGDMRRQGAAPVKTLDGFKWLGGLVAGAGALGGVQDSGVLDQVQNTLGTINDTAASVGSIMSSVITTVEWAISHWWLLAIVLGLYMLYRVGRGFLELVALFRQGVLAR